MNLQIGSAIGDYQVVGILGAGGMGKVYKVRNVISDRVEAMKILLPDLATQTELADRFLREIKLQASLEHPNIAALHTAVRVDNQLLMLMEFVEGITLEQRLKDGPLPVEEAVDYIAQVLSALEYAHQQGVIHRDIKPANMMLTPAGVVKLMDFGIAKAANDQRLTMTGTTMGSLYYMSPEQIRGAGNIDARADLYSVGVSLYELLTRTRPFDGDSQFAIMSAHLEKAPVPPVYLDPKLPQALNDAILMSVAKDPGARFQTAAAFRNALVNLTAPVVHPPVVQTQRPVVIPTAQAITRPVLAPTPPAPVAVAAAVPQKPRGKRGLWMAVGALAMAAAVIAAIEFGPWKETKAAPQTQPVQQAHVQTQTPAVITPQPAAEPPTPSQTQPQTQPEPQTQTAPPPSTHMRAAAHPPAALPQPVVHQPVQQAVQPPAPQPVSQQLAQQPESNAAEMQATRERMRELNLRVNTIKTGLQTLQSLQSLSGLNLGSRFTQPATLMDRDMKGASDALNSNDPETAKVFLTGAEQQIAILEKLLIR